MISVTSAGSDRKHSKNFVINRPHGIGVYDFVLFNSKTVIEIDGELVVTRSNTAILFDRHYKQHYYTNSDFLMNDFVHFDVDHETEKDLLRNVIFNKPFQIEKVDAIRRIIWLITYEYNSINDRRETIMSHLLRALIEMIEVEMTEPGKHDDHEIFARMVSIRSLIKQNPQENWTVKRLADECKMSRSHFQAVYKKIFGTNCISDVIGERLKMARELICTSANSIQEIASSCGYNNIEHFSRQFK